MGKVMDKLDEFVSKVTSENDRAKSFIEDVVDLQRAKCGDLGPDLLPLFEHVYFLGLSHGARNAGDVIDRFAELCEILKGE